MDKAECVEKQNRRKEMQGLIKYNEKAKCAMKADTLAAIDQFGLANRISYISTGGGAFLEFLEGKVLPAVAMLESRSV